MTKPLSPSISKNSIDVETYEKNPPIYVVEADGHRLALVTTTRNAEWRAQHFFDAEPATNRWLAQMTQDDVFFDVGANLGVYALWAAKTTGASVYAFEPESQNYGVLNANIRQNRLSDRIKAYCLAIGNGLQVDLLHLSQFSAGAALHGVTVPRNTQDVYAEGFTEFKPAHSQGTILVSIDLLITWGLPRPTFMKVDIDGLEHHVVQGARELLESGTLRSLLVETNRNLAEHRDMIEHIIGFGYALDENDGENLLFLHSGPDTATAS